MFTLVILSIPCHGVYSHVRERVVDEGLMGCFVKI